MVHPHQVQQSIGEAGVRRDLNAATDMPRIRNRQQWCDGVSFIRGPVRQCGFDVVTITLHMRQLHQHRRKVAHGAGRQMRMIRTVVDARVKTTGQHARIVPVNRMLGGLALLVLVLLASGGIHGIAAVQRGHASHVHIDV